MKSNNKILLVVTAFFMHLLTACYNPTLVADLPCSNPSISQLTASLFPGDHLEIEYPRGTIDSTEILIRLAGSGKSFSGIIPSEKDSMFSAVLSLDEHLGTYTLLAHINTSGTAETVIRSNGHFVRHRNKLNNQSDTLLVLNEGQPGQEVFLALKKSGNIELLNHQLQPLNGNCGCSLLHDNNPG